MEINITCFLQILHFLIGWYILDRLYFRPALAWLSDQATDLRNLHKQIAQIDDRLAQLQQQEHASKQQFMEYCKEHMVAPQRTAHIMLTPAPITLAPSAASAQASAVEEQLVRRIYQKVQTS
jgi:hypothetical protein